MLFVVVIIGPPLLRRARLPGIIGLLLGGFLIGPHGLDLIGAGNTTVPELGQLGLLYLMFVAGVELDLALLRVHRRAVIAFGLITFAIPMTLGTVIGFSQHWERPAALLLGSLLTSHTLLVYPTVRDAGLSTHAAVATAVGATVLTDTASLVVLAAVSGSQLDGGSAGNDRPTDRIGPRRSDHLYPGRPSAGGSAGLPAAGYRPRRPLPARDRLVPGRRHARGQLRHRRHRRAFFAGLGMNRLVPNEGPLMDRIDFFGAAVFIPIFLVTVGMLLGPRVMFEAER